MNVGPGQVLFIGCSVSGSSQCFFARGLPGVALSSVALKTPFGGEVLVLAETKSPHTSCQSSLTTSPVERPVQTEIPLANFGVGTLEMLHVPHAWVGRAVLTVFDEHVGAEVTAVTALLLNLVPRLMEFEQVTEPLEPSSLLWIRGTYRSHLITPGRLRNLTSTHVQLYCAKLCFHLSRFWKPGCWVLWLVMKGFVRST